MTTSTPTTGVDDTSMDIDTGTGIDIGTGNETIGWTRAAEAPGEIHIGGIERKLVAMAAHLDGVVARLNRLPHPRRVDYRLPSIGYVRDLCQRDYRISRHFGTENPAFALRMECHLRNLECIARRQPHDGANSLYTGVHYRSRGFSSTHGRLDVEGFVPVTIAFDAGSLPNSIRITVTNLDGIGEQVYLLAADVVDRALLGEIVKWLMRCPNTFKQRTGARLTSEARRRIRDMVEQERCDREREMGRGRAGALRRLIDSIKSRSRTRQGTESGADRNRAAEPVPARGSAGRLQKIRSMLH